MARRAARGFDGAAAIEYYRWTGPSWGAFTPGDRMDAQYRAWFQCFAGCDERYELNEIIYRCRRCDSLLEVRHDVDALAATPAAEWKEMFARRWRAPLDEYRCRD